MQYQIATCCPNIIWRKCSHILQSTSTTRPIVLMSNLPASTIPMQYQCLLLIVLIAVFTYGPSVT